MLLVTSIITIIIMEVIMIYRLKDINKELNIKLDEHEKLIKEHNNRLDRCLEICEENEELAHTAIEETNKLNIIIMEHQNAQWFVN